MYLKTLALIALPILTVAGAQAADPVGWRMDGNGHYPNATPPTEWSADKNVVWKTPLPSWGNASPILVGERIFVMAEPSTLICLDRRTGRILWQKNNAYADFMGPEDLARIEQARKEAEEIAKQVNPLQNEQRKLEKESKAAPDNAELKEKIKQLDQQIKPLEQQSQRLKAEAAPSTEGSNGYSSPTPASDGANVYAVFGTGVVCAYDLQGNRKWIKLLEKPTEGWGHSASPLLAGGKLFVHILDLVALDPADGKELWRVKSGCHWGSPRRAWIAQTEVVITPGGDVVRAADGQVLAKGISNLEFATPIVFDGVVYFIQNGGKAVRLPAQAAPQAKFESLWQTTPNNERYYASAALHDGLLYAVTRSEVFSIIDAGTGKVIFEKKLDIKGEPYSSITPAGKYLYLSGENGVTVVLEPGRQYKELARNQLEPFRTTPVFSGSRMYVRAKKHMYCISSQEAPASRPATRGQ